MNELQNIEIRVKVIVAQELGIQSDLKNEWSLVDDMGADELDVLELFMAIEDEFRVNIEDEDMERCVTVQHIIDMLTNGTYK